jgi:GNAT superfamily N-acetyltransferase
MQVREGEGPGELDLLEPLWNALQMHHAKVLPALAGGAPPRPAAISWERRRVKYQSWLEDPETFFLLAEDEDEAVGYAFVTVGPAYAGWQTGRLAGLETLSVLSGHRGRQVGGQLLEAAWERLAELGIDEMAITTAITNVDSHRFYERHGFRQAFVIYHGKRGRGSSTGSDH